MRSVTLRILAPLLFGVGILIAPLIAQAAPCSPSMTFTTGQTLTASVLNSNPTTFSGCFSNIDYTNIGSSGLYASNLLPTNASQATFGGVQTYTFPASISVTGGTQTNGFINNGPATVTGNVIWGGVTYGGTLYGATGNINASGTIGLSGTGTNSLGGPLSVSGTVSNTGSTSTGAVKQTVGGTSYTLPYDAQSTGGSTNTHFAHGNGSAGVLAASACVNVSPTFSPAFTAGNIPFVGMSGWDSLGSASNAVYLQANPSNTGFTFRVCNFNGSPATVNYLWYAVGE
jgi:hypothetical protein